MTERRQRAVLAGMIVGGAILALASCGVPDPTVERPAVSKELHQALDVSLAPGGPVADAVVIEPTTTTTLPPGPAPVDPDEVFDGAYFATNSAQLTPDGLAACRAVADRLVGRAGFLAVLGFADTRPTTRAGGNDKLSQDRASTVANCIGLRLAGATDDVPVTTVVRGMGTACPRDPDPLAAVNRRVEVFVTAERVEPRPAACG